MQPRGFLPQQIEVEDHVEIVQDSQTKAPERREQQSGIASLSSPAFPSRVAVPRFHALKCRRKKTRLANPVTNWEDRLRRWFPNPHPLPAPMTKIRFDNGITVFPACAD